MLVLRGLPIIPSPLVETGKPPAPVGVMPAATVAPARAVALTIVLINALLVLVGRALVKDVGLRRP